jgi:hypothetical protein
MENNAFDYNSLARTLMGYRKLPWNPGWLLPEEPINQQLSFHCALPALRFPEKQAAIP